MGCWKTLAFIFVFIFPLCCHSKLYITPEQIHLAYGGMILSFYTFD